jgi:hypothetical protein
MLARGADVAASVYFQFTPRGQGDVFSPLVHQPKPGAISIGDHLCDELFPGFGMQIAQGHLRLPANLRQHF